MELAEKSCFRCMRGIAHCGMCGDELEHFHAVSNQSEDEDRMDVVGSNGNEGLHYDNAMHDNISAMHPSVHEISVAEYFAEAVSPGLLKAASTLSETKFNSSGSKYLRNVACLVDGKLDVYAVLDAFGVTCPARQHAIKKLLCSGIRNKGSTLQDLSEARDAIERAIQMQIAKGL